MLVVKSAGGNLTSPLRGILTKDFVGSWDLAVLRLEDILHVCWPFDHCAEHYPVLEAM